MRRRIGIACVVILALASAACSDDDSDSSDTSTTTAPSTPATTGPSTSPSTSPPSSAPELSPEQCGQALYDAWAGGDQGAAPSCASAAAVQQIFSEPFATGYQGPSCDGAAGSVFCTWTSPETALVMEIRSTTGGLPVEVISVTRTGTGT